MSGTLLAAVFQRLTDANGHPIVNGKVWSYNSGTAVPADTYTTAALNVKNLNPIRTNARGEFTAWVPDDASLKLVITDENDVLLMTVDNVTSVALSAAAENAITAVKRDTFFFQGSDAAALMGVAVVAGTSKAARAPGTGLIVILDAGNYNFDVTLWAEAGATATVMLTSSAAPDVAIANSTLTSVHAEGEHVENGAAIALAAGTYLIKGHSNDAAKQAWALGYRLAPV